jgi:hypothetical protein
MSTQAPKSIPVQRIVSRDKNNILCASLFLVINGQAVKPNKPLGFVWGTKTWVNLGERYSRKEFVFEAFGVAYRMGSKSAKPLKLAADEKLEPMGFSGNDSNAFIPA